MLKDLKTSVNNTIIDCKTVGFFFSEPLKKGKVWRESVRVSVPCYTAVARLGFKRRAIAVPNSIHKLQMH